MVKNLCCARGVIKVVNQLKTCEHLGVHWHKDDPKAKTHGLQAKKSRFTYLKVALRRELVLFGTDPEHCSEHLSSLTRMER